MLSKNEYVLSYDTRIGCRMDDPTLTVNYDILKLDDLLFDRFDHVSEQKIDKLSGTPYVTYFLKTSTKEQEQLVVNLTNLCDLKHQFNHHGYDVWEVFKDPDHNVKSPEVCRVNRALQSLCLGMRVCGAQRAEAHDKRRFDDVLCAYWVLENEWSSALRRWYPDAPDWATNLMFVDEGPHANHGVRFC